MDKNIETKTFKQAEMRGKWRFLYRDKENKNCLSTAWEHLVRTWTLVTISAELFTRPSLLARIDFCIIYTKGNVRTVT